jgi:DNA-binding PadR family transcriptional regulator
MFEADEELLILGSLSQHPMDIDELSAHMQFEQAMPWTDLDPDQVNKTLHFLRRARLIEWRQTDSGRGPIYTITKAGRETLASWLTRTLIINGPVIFPFDLAVNALGVLSLEERHQLIEKRRSAVLARLAQYDEIAGKLGEDQVPYKAILQHHQIYLQAELKWLDALDADVGNWDSEGEE